MSELQQDDWAKVGSRWQQQESGMALSEGELHRRLHRQRIITMLVTGAEVLSLAVVLAAAAWMSRLWLTEPGASPILILLLLLPACIVLWRRWRQRASEATRGLEDIDAVIAREERMLESVRLGSVLSQLALVAMIMVVLVHMYHHWPFLGIASLVSLALMFTYVFGLQIALAVWARRLRLQRSQLEVVRRALHPPE